MHTCWREGGSRSDQKNVRVHPSVRTISSCVKSQNEQTSVSGGKGTKRISGKREAERAHPLDRPARPVHLGPNALEQRPWLIPPPLRFQRPPKRPHQIPLPLSQTHCPRQEKWKSETLLDGREAGVVASKFPYQITRERLDDRVQRPHAPNALVDDDPHG